MTKAIAWAKAHLDGDTARASSELCLAAMIAGASGDGRVGETERLYVLDVAAKLPGLGELTESERTRLVDRAIGALKDADAKVALGTLAKGANEDQKRAAYALACLAALSDGVATDEELDHLLEVRDGIGLSDGDAADVEAMVRTGSGAKDVYEEDGVAWRLAEPETKQKAVAFAQKGIDPSPLAPYADACVEAMVLAAAADGTLSPTEAEHIHELAEKLPVLGGIDGHELERFVRDAAGRISREGADRRLQALAAWLPAEARIGAYTLACVIALADHRATEEELMLLEEMRRRFGIAEGDGDRILDTVRDEVYA